MSGTAYAVVTIHGTQGHDWGANKEVNPPGCSQANPCGHLIQGTLGDDRIYGHAGWDWIGAKSGNDVVFGGPGMEQMYGDHGRDKLHGGRGHDHLFGESNNDKLFLQDGQDEPGHVEQAMGGYGTDYCVVDEDPRDGLIIGDCDTLMIKDVKDMTGATRIARGVSAYERGEFIPKKFYPGTYHF